MVTEILCGVSGVAIGYVGYLIATLKAAKKEAQHDRLYDNLHTKYTNLVSEDVQLQADYKQLKQDFEQLADEHNELKEKYKPLAALNPFERQAVGAVTNQSILDEWMNGEIKEGN